VGAQEVELVSPEFGIAALHLEVLLGVELPDHGQAQDRKPSPPMSETCWAM